MPAEELEASIEWKRMHQMVEKYFMESTPRKTNMEPENGGLEDDLPFQTGDFQVPC